MEHQFQEIISYYQNQPYPTQTQCLYDMLLEIIALNALPEQETFTEQELMKLTQAGRTPLHEALKLLEFNHVVKIIPRVGVRMCTIHLEDYYLQAEARSTLEKLVTLRACRLSTEKSRSELKKLNGAYAAFVEKNDRLSLYRVDHNIHMLLDTCCKNPYLVHALAPLRFFEQRVHFLLSQTYPQINEELNREHISYVDEVIAGRADEACAHFDNMASCTARLLKQQIDMQNSL